MRKFVTLAVAALTLSGCFEASQDFWFGEDGTAKFNMRMAMDASFVAMTETDGDPFCGDNYAEAAGKRDVIVSSERSTSGSDAVCEISMEGKTDTILDLINSGALVAGGNEAVTDEEGPDFSLTKSNGQYTLEIVVPPLGQMLEDDDEMGEAVINMITASAAGRTISWSVTAPEIIDTTGELSDDGTVSSFSVPVAELIRNTTDPYEFRTVFATETSGFFQRLFGGG